MPVVADTTLILGLAAVGGTLGAAGLGNYTLLRLEARRERGHRRERASSVLQAVRLIDEELAWSARALRRASETTTWWLPGQGPSLEAWQKYAPAMAGEVAAATWGSLGRAAMAVRVILRIADEVELSPAAAANAAVTAELSDAVELIMTARILIRPVLLGGSTFPRDAPPGHTWLPAVPELGPWDLWPRWRWWLHARRRRLRKRIPTDSGGSREIVP